MKAMSTFFSNFTPVRPKSAGIIANLCSWKYAKKYEIVLLAKAKLIRQFSVKLVKNIFWMKVFSSVTSLNLSNHALHAFGVWRWMKNFLPRPPYFCFGAFFFFCSFYYWRKMQISHALVKVTQLIGYLCWKTTLCHKVNFDV